MRCMRANSVPSYMGTLGLLLVPLFFYSLLYSPSAMHAWLQYEYHGVSALAMHVWFLVLATVALYYNLPDSDAVFRAEVCIELLLCLIPWIAY